MSSQDSAHCAAGGSAASGVRRVLLMSRGGALDGEQRQMCHLAAALGRHGYKPVVLLDAAGGPCAAELRQQGVELAILPTRDWRRFPEMLLRGMDARRVLRMARAWDIDLVHASNRWKSHYALWVARQMKIPCVLHVRGPMSPHDVDKHGFRKAAAVIAISVRYEQDLLRMGFDGQRVHVVDDAVDFGLLYPDAAGRGSVRAEWDLGPRVAVGLVGRVEPFKRTAEFLEAISHVSPAASAVWLLIGQPGPAKYMRRVRQIMTSLKLEDRVRFVGHRGDMRQVLSALDLLVSFSGGSVIFEAMACGTPVMSVRAADRPSVHARHDETAWCLTTQDPRAIAREMEQLIADGARRQRLACAGRGWVNAHLSTETLAAGTAAAYAQALQGGKVR